MGKASAKREKATAHHVVSRRRVVRSMFVAGMAEGAIVQALVQGVEVDGVRYCCSDATARRDLAAISDEFRAIFDSDDAIEREIGAAWEAYKTIARRAQSGSKPNYHAAIAALDRVVKIAASRSARWAQLAGGGRAVTEPPRPLVDEPDAELTARAQELAALGLDELRDYHRSLRERVDALGLEVVDGGGGGG